MSHSNTPSPVSTIENIFSTPRSFYACSDESRWPSALVHWIL